MTFISGDRLNGLPRWSRPGAEPSPTVWTLPDEQAGEINEMTTGTGVASRATWTQESHFYPEAAGGLRGFTVPGINQQGLFIEGQAAAGIQTLQSSRLPANGFISRRRDDTAGRRTGEEKRAAR